MSGLVRVVVVAISLLLPFGALPAQELTGAELRSLDGQVQEIKTDVLAIAAELGNLEERLLYPSNTQLALFVSLDQGDDVRLDAVQIAIDGELATHHIYSFKELDALRKGGMQRIYTGNVTTGTHELTITMSGKLSSGSDFEHTDKFSFSKDVEPAALGIALNGSDAIQVAAW